MKLFIDPHQILQEAYATAKAPAVPAPGEETGLPSEVERFLAHLRLLENIPFQYLVPDSDLLPPESIRFFYLDRNWTDAAVDGALAAGTFTTSIDETLKLILSWSDVSSTKGMITLAQL